MPRGELISAAYCRIAQRGLSTGSIAQNPQAATVMLQAPLQFRTFAISQRERADRFIGVRQRYGKRQCLAVDPPGVSGSMAIRLLVRANRSAVVPNVRAPDIKASVVICFDRLIDDAVCTVIHNLRATVGNIYDNVVASPNSCLHFPRGSHHRIP